MKKTSNADIPDSPVLCEGPQGLELRVASETAGSGVRFDVTWLRHALKRGLEHLRGDPLARAVAAPASEHYLIIDATAGLGGDSLLFAALGHQVLAFERNPTIWKLLDDGLARMRADAQVADIVSRITLQHGDARDLLKNATPRPEIVYIDPMFPLKRRESALPAKELQRLRQIVGRDEDATALFEAALHVATRRIVVKRPNDANPLAPGVIATHSGKTIHYDVYHPARSEE